MAFIESTKDPDLCMQFMKLRAIFAIVEENFHGHNEECHICAVMEDRHPSRSPISTSYTSPPQVECNSYTCYSCSIHWPVSIAPGNVGRHTQVASIWASRPQLYPQSSFWIVDRPCQNCLDMEYQIRQLYVDHFPPSSNLQSILVRICFQRIWQVRKKRNQTVIGDCHGQKWEYIVYDSAMRSRINPVQVVETLVYQVEELFYSVDHDYQWMGGLYQVIYIKITNYD